METPRLGQHLGAVRVGAWRGTARSPARSRAGARGDAHTDRKSTRLNSSHSQISYAGFCLKKTMSCTSRSDSALGRGRRVRSRTMVTARFNALSRRANTALTVVMSTLTAHYASAGLLTLKT